MTLYRRTDDSAFGLTETEVRATLSDLSLPADLEAADLSDFGFAAYVETAPPAAAWDEQAVETAPVDSVQQWSLEPNGRTLAVLKSERLEALAARRKVASQNFAFAGMPLKLDPDTENAISKAIMSLARQPGGTVINWEVSRGVIVPFDLATLEAIGDAAFLHVQACFTNVAAITALILAASDAEALDAVDLNAGWP